MLTTTPAAPSGSDAAFRAWNPIPGQSMTELRDAAVSFARHRWPVLPGTFCLDGRSGWRGRPQSIGLEPIHGVSASGGGLTAEQAFAEWSVHPYSVLLACGSVLEALEIPAQWSRRVTTALRSAGVVAPTVRSGSRLSLLVRPGGQVRTGVAGLLRRGEGAWVAVPPTVQPGLSHNWVQSPRSVAWVLPDGDAVGEVVAAVLAGATEPEGPQR